MRKYIAEFIGTFVLVAFGCGSAVAANSIFISMGSPLPIAFTTLLIAFAFGLTIVAMAYSIGNISGCHINPAVSLGMLITGRMEVKDFVGYLVGQFLGAVAAALFLMVVFDGRDALGANGYGSSSAVGISMMGAIGLEIVMTFVFVLVVLGVTAKKEYAPVAGLVIGLSLTLIHIFGIPFTGTSVNPARSFGPAVVSGGDALVQLPVFIIAPLIGGALAAVVFRLLFTEEEGDTAEHSIIDGLTAKFTAGVKATEELLDDAGDEFEETYDSMVSDETGLEGVSKVLDEAGDEFEETFESMRQERSERVEEETGEVSAAEIPAEEAPVEEEAVAEESVEADSEEVESEEEPGEEDTEEASEISDGKEFDETYELMKENRNKKKSEKVHEETPVEEPETPAEEASAEEAEAPAEEAEASAEEEEASAEEEVSAEEPETPAEEETPLKEEPAEEEAQEESSEDSTDENPEGNSDEPAAEDVEEEESAEEEKEAAEEEPAESVEEPEEEEKTEKKQPASHRSKKRKKKNPKHQK